MLPQHPQHADWLVHRLIAQYGPVVAPGHPWFDESERWGELAFAVVSRGSSVDEHSLRAVFRVLARMGLLDVDRLANLGESDREELHEFLVSLEVPKEEAGRIVQLLSELASSVEQRFGGRIQHWLRAESERMSQGLAETLALASIPRDELREAVTFWLQNACGLPVPLSDASTRAWCEEQGTSFEEVARAADRADLNLAFVDDLIVAALRDGPNGLDASR